jgi:hypothetical protein
MRDDEDDRPRRRRRDGDDDERPTRRRPREGGSVAWVFWLVGGLVGLVVLTPLLCCGGCALLGTRLNNSPPPPIAQGGNGPPPPGPAPAPAGPQNPGPEGGLPPPAPPPAEPPVHVVSANRLAQELFDDPDRAFGRHVVGLLEVEGVVREQEKAADGAVATVVFVEPVVHRRTRVRKEYRIWCRLDPPVPPGSKAAARLAVGETVTLRAKLTGAGVGPEDPQATLNKCALVGDVVAAKPGGEPAKPPPAAAVPPPALGRWQVRPDPLPDGLTLPERAGGKVPLGGSAVRPNEVVEQVIFPTSPSPFVSVAVKGPTHDAHEVWDLRTMKRVGVTVKPEDPFSRAALSPDGAYFAVPSLMPDPGQGAEVYAVADGRLSKLPVITEKGQSFHEVDFAGPGQVVTLIQVSEKAGPEVLVQVWDIKERKELRRFKAAASLDRNQRAFSPGRRYIALTHREPHRLQLYDLTTAELAGELPLPADSQTVGLSFSPDGKLLAGLFKEGGATRLLAWNLDGGTGSARFTLGSEAVPKVEAYLGPALDWMPDNSGWVVYGRRIVDRQIGEYYWPIPAEKRDASPRRIFPDARLAYVGSERGKTFLFIVPLQKELMDEALKRVRRNH